MKAALQTRLQCTKLLHTLHFLDHIITYTQWKYPDTRWHPLLTGIYYTFASGIIVMIITQSTDNGKV